MNTITANEKNIKRGNEAKAGRKRYWPLVISGTLFSLAFACDLMWATALAEKSNMHWLWGLALLTFLGVFYASLKLDHFKILHYLVDHAGIHLQYQIATGPLEKSTVIHRTKAWTDIKSAAFSSRNDEDGSETHDAVVFLLERPIESGRFEIELKSERPEQIMALFHRHIEQVQVSLKSERKTLAIG